MTDTGASRNNIADMAFSRLDSPVKPGNDGLVAPGNDGTVASGNDGIAAPRNGLITTTSFPGLTGESRKGQRRNPIHQDAGQALMRGPDPGPAWRVCVAVE